MALTKKARGRPLVLLPWEQRRAFFSDLLRGRRWRTVGLGIAALGLLWFGARKADERARIRVTRAGIAEVQRAVAAFHAELGRCPRSAVELVHPPKAGARYLDEMPNDGWGRPLHVRCPNAEGAESARVLSAGPSGSFLIDDNIM